MRRPSSSSASSSPPVTATGEAAPAEGEDSAGAGLMSAEEEGAASDSSSSSSTESIPEDAAAVDAALEGLRRFEDALVGKAGDARAAEEQLLFWKSAPRHKNVFKGTSQRRLRPKDLDHCAPSVATWQDAVEHVLNVSGQQGPVEFLERSDQKCDNRWRASQHPEQVAVAADGCTVQYVGRGNGTVFGGRIVARRPSGYFEARLKARGTSSDGVQIGYLFGREVETPGMGSLAESRNAFVYAATAGLFYSRGKALPFSACHDRCVDGDVIGCGVDQVSGSVFFTKNGQFIGSIPLKKHRNADLFPCACLLKQGEEFQTNFGPDFLFDVKKMREAIRDGQNAEISSYSIQQEVVTELVKEYLEFHGYEETLNAFAEENFVEKEENHGLGAEIGLKQRALQAVFSEEYLESSCGLQTDEAPFASIEKRNELRRTIMEGRPLEALQKMAQWLPKQALTHVEYVSAVNELKAQHFIELVRKKSLDAAIEFARNDLETEIASKLISLIAYEDPFESPYRGFLSSQQREEVADIVNKAVLSCRMCADGAQEGEMLVASSPRAALDTVLTHLILARMHSDA